MNMNINTLVKGFDDSFENWFSFLKNDYVSSVISLILVLYAGLAAPQLSENVVKIFDNTLVKLVIFFLIAYSANKNPTIAIIAAVGVLISLMTLNKWQINFKISKMANGKVIAPIVSENEGFSHMTNMPMVEMPKIDGGVEDHLSEMALGEIQGEQIEVPMTEEPSCSSQCGSGGCTKVANFRNSFYPQYVNMKPDAYMSKYTGNSIDGYDSTAAYSSI